MENKELQSNPQKFFKLHELVGRISDKEKDKSYKGKYAGKDFYRLKVKIENKEGVDTIYAFADIVEKESIWQDILASNYIDKRYLFYCLLKTRKGVKCFGLKSWKELNNKANGSN